MVEPHSLKEKESKKKSLGMQHETKYLNQNLKSFIMLTVKLFDKRQAEDILDKSLTSLITSQYQNCDMDAQEIPPLVPSWQTESEDTLSEQEIESARERS